MHIFIAIAFGLLINHLTGGLDFNTMLCFFAGIFLIMPPLLNFKVKDFLLLKDFKAILLLDIVINFVLIPFLFFCIGFIFLGNAAGTYALLLLGFLPGGGMLFSWIQKTGGNIKFSFPIFFLNILIFSSIFFQLNIFLEQKGEEISNKNIENLFINKNEEACFLDTLTYGSVNCSFGSEGGVNPISIIIALIIFPFLLSRIILVSEKLTNFLKPKIKIISQIATFTIITYIFSLKSMNIIFDTNYFTIFKFLGIILLIYVVVYTMIYMISFSNLINKDINIALFWNSATRFITLGLILSFIYKDLFGVDFLLIMSLGYIVQISLSSIIAKIITKK
ncbi:MAG: hypothetical protein WC850_04750 [Candidatus Gracilibacteria bacterium]